MKQIFKASLLSLVTFLFAVNAFSQIDTILVSAEKRMAQAQKTPISLSVINPTNVEQLQINNIKDLKSIVPNFYSADPGDGRNATSIRGIATTSYDPTIAVNIDGVNQFNLDTYIPEIFDIERIEILRGPQGSLYGRNAMGGVINIYTKQPSNTSALNASILGGNYNQFNAKLSYRTPLVRNKLFFGISEMYDKRDGFYKNKYTGKDYDYQFGLTGNYFLKYIMSPNWEATINYKHRNYDNYGPFPLTYDASEGFSLNQNATTIMKDKTNNASFVLHHNGRSFDFIAQSAFQDNYRYYTRPIDGDFSPLDGISIVNNYGNNWNHIKVYTQEIRLHSNNTTKLKWTAGAYYFNQLAPNKQATVFGSQANLLGIGDKNFSILNTTDAKRNGFAVYGQINYALTNQLHLTLGARNDWENASQTILGEYTHAPMPNYIITTPSTSGSASFNAFSPKFALDYQLSDRHLAFVSYSKGFRAGGLSPLGSDPSQPPMIAFQPEFSSNYELGFKNNYYNNRLLINTTFFYSKIDNAQMPTLVMPDALTITKNVGKLHSSGIELDAFLQATKTIAFQYHAGITNAIFDNFNLAVYSNEVNVKGKHQIFSPDATSCFAMHLNQPINKTTSFLLNADWKYTGTTYFDVLNNIKQSPYNTLNGSIGIQYTHFKLMAWTRNITDVQYINYAYDFGAVHLGEPKRFGITASVQL